MPRNASGGRMYIVLTQAPKGTKDILPANIINWYYLENAIRRICAAYGYKEIRTPMFEHTELFKRGIGDTTDIVEKEMYTFNDLAGRSITLRPENTAAAVRAFIENKLYADNPLVKLFYIGPMFRYDTPQAGRFRQFHQFGAEAIGLPGPDVDAEIIMLAVQFLRELGLKKLKILLNSVGCPKCRPGYRKRLQEHLRENFGQLCEDCRSRFDRNPMRILDCKEEKCRQAAVGAPALQECLCDECAEHFAGLQKYLQAVGLAFELDNTLVRGLDYYTKTAFEIQCDLLGAQSAVCGGGRYDGLVEEVGGDPTPGIGFAIGMERVLILLENQGLLPPQEEKLSVFVAHAGQGTNLAAFKLLTELRSFGVAAEMDFSGRGMKSQFKLANRLNAQYVLVMGENELKKGVCALKNMQTGEQVEMPLGQVHDAVASKL